MKISWDRLKSFPSSAATSDCSSGWSDRKQMIQPRATVASIAACLLCMCMPSIRAQNDERGAHTEFDVPMEVPQSEAFDHRATGSHLIHYTGRSGYVQLKTVVTHQGTVLTATPVSGLRWWYDEATSLAKAWRYVPFRRNGKPVTASFTDEVFVVPPERRPTVSPSEHPFPGSSRLGQRANLAS